MRTHLNGRTARNEWPDVPGAAPRRKTTIPAVVRALILVLGVAFASLDALAQSPPDAVGARLRALEDREEIRLLLLDYGRHLDSREFKAYASLFAADGEWVGGFGTVKGPAAIQAFMEKNLGTAPNRAGNYHLLSNFVITVQGDTATAWSRWAFIVPEANGARVAQAGRYDDTLVRENGRWKFKKRVASNDTPPPASAAP
jgi:uncharacterized protein (TIGR02246 family)